MPVARPGAVHLYRQPTLPTERAGHGLGRGGAADVAKADGKNAGHGQKP